MIWHVAWRVAALVVVLAAAACDSGTNLEGDAPDGREDGDGSVGDDGDGAADADACVPSCEGRGCVDDGCGGVCPCGADQVCIVDRGECVAARGWIEVPRKPVPTVGASMAFDSRRHVVVLFDGWKTWEYDGTTWTEVAPPMSPWFAYPYPGLNAMVYDSRRGIVVLFGGESEVDAGTWEYDGTTWTKILTRTSPPARTGHGMAFDSGRGVTVLWGGMTEDYPAVATADTWEYDGTTWTEIRPPASPPASACPFLQMAYDASRRVTLLYGIGETWSYDGTTWTEIFPSASPSTVPPHTGPSRGAGAWAAYDADRGVIVLLVGVDVSGLPTETWEWDGTTWRKIETTIAPPGRSEQGMAYDSFRHVMVVAAHSATWEYDGTTWREVGTATWPPFDISAAAYDSVRGDVVAFADWRQFWSVPTPGPCVGDLWRSSGATWSDVPDRGTGLCGPAMVFDSARDRTVVLGSGSDTDPARTLEFDGATWTTVASARQPTAWTRNAMAFDPVRGVAVLFGGGYCEGRPCGDTWEYDGDWVQMMPSSSPAARTGLSLAWDSARNVVVLFGGSTAATGLAGDTWEYDGGNWNERNPPSSPPPRSGHGLAYDTARGVVVLFGGSTRDAALDDTWEYDGTTWIRVVTRTTPPATRRAVMTYDPARSAVVLFNGGDVGEIWEYCGP